MNKKNLFLSGIFISTLLFAPSNTNASEIQNIEELERKLVEIESQLLEPELRLDQLQKERSKLDSVGGWFQINKKKILDEEIKQTETLVTKQYSAMKSTAEQVQKMVYEVAFTFEKKGSYDKAIEYYLKVQNRTDNVRLRIASCYKAKTEYYQAIKWLLEMTRKDETLLEVVDCYKLAGDMKEAVYWLFEILVPWSDSPTEMTALTLIEKYDYPNHAIDYPNFNERLSDIYLTKALSIYDSNFLQASKDYQKAINLLAAKIQKDPKMLSYSVLERFQNNYKVALDILERQREAAERNFEDRVRQAKIEIQNSEERLRYAERQSIHVYESRLREAEDDVKRAENRLRELKQNPNTSPTDIDTAQRRLDSEKRNLEDVRHNRQRIIRDYVEPYQREVTKARNQYEELLSNRKQIIDKYIAPYKKEVNESKKSLDKIKAMHDANFN